jgi:hypothetical protein
MSKDLLVNFKDFCFGNIIDTKFSAHDQAPFDIYLLPESRYWKNSKENIVHQYTLKLRVQCPSKTTKKGWL